MNIIINADNIHARTADIVAAYVGCSEVTPDKLPALIKSVHDALTAAGSIPDPEPAPSAEKPKPAVPVSKSIFDDYLISLETGQKLKSLKRHLGTFGMTPAQYRTKWNLPASYPMVAPGYSKKRSDLAKAAGLGKVA